MKWILNSVIAISFLGLVAPAQEFRGRITGRVVDSTGGVIVGVQVKAANVETNVPSISVSNDHGNFEISYLQPGSYRISVEHPGFKKYVRDAVEVRMEDVVSLDILLSAGGVNETVTVSAETQLLELNNSSGQVVDSRRLADLPTSGSNPFTLVQLSSDVVSFSSPNHGSTAPSVEVVGNIGGGGVRSQNTEFSLDGAPSMWGSNPSFAPPIEMVAEMKVQTGKYDAGTGRGAGGAVNIAMRSGANALHATLSEFHNNNHLLGLDLFQRRLLYDASSGPPTDAKLRSIKPQHVFNRFGATASGPVEIPGLYNGKNRTFWIYGFDGHTRPSFDNGSYYFTVPSLKERQGDLSELLAAGSRYQVYDPGTIAPAASGRFSRSPFPNNLIPKSRLDPMALSFMKYWPEPNIAGTVDGQRNYFHGTPNYSGYFAHIARVDHNLSTNHRLFVRYNQSHQLWSSGEAFQGAKGSDRDRFSKGAGLDDVFIINPKLLLNVRYSLSRFVEAYRPTSAGFDLLAAGFPKSLVAQLDPRAAKIPQIAVSGYTTLSETDAKTGASLYHTWAAELSRMQGNHSMRFGTELRLYRKSSYDLTDGTPSFAFDTQWTRGPLDNSASSPIGQGLASYLLGLPSTGTAQVNGSYVEQSIYSAGFFQDDIKLSPRLTLNAGLRYEYEGPTTERFNRSTRGFDPNVSSPLEAAARAAYVANPVPGVPADQFQVKGGLLFAGTGGQPRGLWNPDRRNFAPRLGFAYQLASRMVVRGGYGLFYLPAGVDKADVKQRGYSQSTTLTPSIDNGLTFTATFANPFPGGIQAAAGSSKGVMTDVGRTIDYYIADRPHAFVQRWTVSLERQFGSSLLVEAGYTGSRGSRLYATRQLDAVPGKYYSTLPYRDTPANDFLTAQVPNPFYPNLPGTDLAGRTVARSQLLRPFPQFSGITASEPAGYSDYHAARLRLEKRMKHGFTIQGNYTFSKFLEATSYLNSFDTVPERVISDQDRPQRFSLSGIWELPFGRGRRLASNWNGVPRFIVSGWQMQAICQAASGAPLSFGNIFFYGDVHNIPLPIADRGIDGWFNVDAGFERDSSKQPASNVRTFPTRLTGARAPGVYTWNSSLMRKFKVRERMTLQFRVELTDALGSTFFPAPNTTVTSSLFGKISGATGYPRSIFLAGKLQF